MLGQPKPTLETTFLGITCLNPFWLASEPLAEWKTTA